MHPSVAISETVTGTAFELVNRGYTQSRQSLACPICGKKYLLLLDSNAYRRASDVTQSAEVMALDYFTQRLRESHQSGHHEEEFVMA